MMRHDRGYIFIQALVVVAVLVALMAMLVADQRASLQEVQNRLRLRRADAAVDAALARALSVLQEADINRVTLNDDWAVLGDNGNIEFDLGDGPTFRMQIVDAGSLVNVNTAPQAQLQLLPLTQDQVDCLLDWREAKTEARADGAKDGYYNSLPQPYNTNLGPLTTVDELLLVRGWTAQTLYQLPTGDTSVSLPTDAAGNDLPLAALLTVDSGGPNTRAEGTPRINLGQGGVDVNALTQLGISQPLAGRIAAQAPYTNFQGLFQVPGMTQQALQPLLDAVTFTGDERIPGKINLNTATQSVLMTVPNMTSDIAAAIVSQQTNGFDSLGQLATVSGVTPQNLAQLADSFTVGGDTWIIRAYGRSGGVGAAVEAVVGLRGGQVQILTWDRLNTAAIPAWWDWSTEPSSTADAGASL